MIPGPSRPARPRRPSAGIFPVLLAALLPCACHAPPAGGPPPERPDAPAWADLAQLQNERVAKLGTIYAPGVVEFRWTDDDGKEHFEPQVNLDLWVNLPHRTALRLEKLGDVLYWLGSDDDRFWLFDLASDERVLYTWPHAYVIRIEAAAISIRPLVLLDLMGLVPLPPPDDPEPPTLRFDDTRDAWTVRVQGRGGPVRIAFDPRTRLPMAVDAIGDDGSVVATSRLERYTPVRRTGMAPLDFPRLPEIIRINDPAGASDINLFLSEPDDGTNPEQPFDRVFDLARLRRAMPTDRVEGDLDTTPVATP